MESLIAKSYLASLELLPAFVGILDIDSDLPSELLPSSHFPYLRTHPTTIYCHSSFVFIP